MIVNKYSTNFARWSPKEYFRPDSKNRYVHKIYDMSCFGKEVFITVLHVTYIKATKTCDSEINLQEG